jgi:hypothetical protein
MSAKTAGLSTTPHPLGKPGGPGLFHTKGATLDPYIENIANTLMKKRGLSKSQAIQMAIGVVKNWASGKGNVSPEVRAAAAKAVAAWEASRAAAKAKPNEHSNVSGGIELAVPVNLRTGARQKAAKAGEAMPDGSYPIRNVTELHKAIQAVGRAKDSTAVKKHIIKRAKALKAAGVLPGKWTASLSNSDADITLDFAAKTKKAATSAPTSDKQSAAFGAPPLPKGATHYKHGWIPVNAQGQPVGPAQKPKWLQNDEKKQIAAGGKTENQIQQDSLTAQRKAAANKAEAPAKKAAAARKAAKSKAETEAKAEVKAEQSKAKKATSAKTKAAAEATRRKNAATRKAATAAKAKVTAAKKAAAARTATIKAAYKQAMTDKKAGRTLTPAQNKVIAFYEKQQAQTAAQLRSVTLSRPFELTRVNDTGLVLDFANLPKGQLAFRYKHGWILINPAIPSRGHLGGGLAKSHGHISGTVTHGHFETHPSGKGKVFVADRKGGLNSPSKLKAAHVSKIDTVKPDKSKFTTAAVSKAEPAEAAEPKPSALSLNNAADAKSLEAVNAGLTADKSGDAHDYQVAAKKHADAFVAHKKAGNTQTADSHKKAAQSFAVEANMVKKSGADKNQTYMNAKATALAASTKANTDELPESHKAAAHTHEDAAAAAHGAKNPKAQKTHEAIADYHAAQYAKLHAAEQKTELTTAKELAENATTASQKAAQEKTKMAHLDAVAAHTKAAAAFHVAGKPLAAKNHQDAAHKHADMAAKAGAPEPEPETVAPPHGSKSTYEAVNAAMDELEAEPGGPGPGALYQWDDYMNASAQVLTGEKSKGNLANLQTAHKALTGAGTTPEQLKHANKTLMKHLKGEPAKKSEPAKPEVATVAQKISLPGPGMYNDGNAIKDAQAKVDAMPDGTAKQAAQAAVNDAKIEFKDKHGKEFQETKAGVIEPTSSTFMDSTSSTNKFYDNAVEDGFKPVSPNESANGDWKPSDVPGLKSNGGAYHYSGGSYMDINAQLRKYKAPTGGSNDVAIARMDKEFAAVPPLNEGIVTTRRMQGDGPFPPIPPGAQPGDSFIDEGYGSTSKSPGMWSGDTVIQVRIPKGSRVLDLNYTTGSQNAAEQEILLNRKTSYKIVSDSMVGTERHIITEVSQA